MLAYVTIGTNKKEEALAFYDAIAAELGGARAFNNDRLQFYSNGEGGIFGVGTPHDLEDATCGNGVMPALGAPSREAVDKAYAKAIEMGATDEGAPGERVPTFYGGYFRDLDGNKICVCKFG
ncbi:MAG: VOC family protein [Pseudomonadota bacterium]